MSNGRGLVPKEAKAKSLIYGRIPTIRLVGLLMTMAVAGMFVSFVRIEVQVIITILMPVIWWILTSKDPVNPTKIYVKGLSTFLIDQTSPKYYISIQGAGHAENQKIRDKEAHTNETKSTKA